MYRTIVFEDHPEFTPNLTPPQIFAEGAFGGTYWRSIHSGVTGRNYNNQHREFNYFFCQRQKNRRAFAGPKGRFFLRLKNMVGNKHSVNDFTISPVIRQGLHQWAKVITIDDF